MRFLDALYIFLAAAAAAYAQTGADTINYFPSDLESRELHAIVSEDSFSDPQRLSGIEDGKLISDVGFDSYALRTYSAGNNGSLSVEVIRLRDSRAAYSLLTLVRDGDIREGPPGDAYTSNADTFRFAQGRQWIRVRGRGLPIDLLQRTAASISSKIGTTRAKPPALISHFPKIGYDVSSLKYFPGTSSFESFSVNLPGGIPKLDLDLEIAQARYSVKNQTGVLSLLNFPTWEIAEQYYSEMWDPESVKNADGRTYAKRSGPLLAVLEGAFDADTANSVLSSIKYSYSIRWIVEKRAKSNTIWGVPVGILKTVVQSIFFVVLVGGVSLLAGICIAVFRLVIRRLAPNNPLDRPERTEITQLRMR
jgi:hypothetical protein